MTDRVGGRAPSPQQPRAAGAAATCAALSERLDGAVVALVAIDLAADTVVPLAVHDPDPVGQAALDLLLHVAVPLAGTICAEVAATGAPAIVGEGGAVSDDALPDGWLHYSRQHGIEVAAAVPVEALPPVAQIVVVARRRAEPFEPQVLAEVAAHARRMLGEPEAPPAPVGPRPPDPSAAREPVSGRVPVGVDVVLGALPPVALAAVLGDATNPNSYRPTSVLVLAVAALGLLRGRVAAASCAVASMGVIWWAFTAPYRSLRIEDGRSVWGLIVLGVAMAAMWLLVDRVDRGRRRLADAAGLSDALVEQMPVGFALVGRDRRLRRVNQRYADLTSTAREDLLGGLPSVLHPATGPRTEALVEQVFDQEAAILDTVLDADRPHAGIEHTWRVNHFPVRSRDQVVAVGMTLEDVTEDVTIRRRAQLLLRMSRRVAGATTADEIAAAVTETLSEGLRGRSLFVAAQGEPARVVSVSGYHETGAEAAFERFEIRRSDPGPLAASLRACELVVGPTGLDDGDEAVAHRAAGDATVVWQPVVRPGDSSASAAIGVAWPYDRHLTEHSRTLLQTAASVTGLALARVELTERAARDRFRTAMDAMLDQVVLARAVRDPSGAIEDFEVGFANAASLAASGRSAADTVGGRVRGLFPGIVRSGLYDRLCQVVETGEAWEVDRLPYVDRTADGREVSRWVSIQVMKVDDGYLAASRDVTDLVEADRLAAEAREALQREHLAVDLLQRAALPSTLPRVAGVDIGAHYRPARLRQPVGGDWYDVFVLDDGELALVVADVAGHGQEAAAYMVQVRNIFRAVATEHRSPDAVLAGVDRVLDRLNDPGAPFVTCCYATLQPTTGELRWALAGHPPPVVVRRDGSALVGETVPGPPLATLPGGRYGVGATRLAAGDLLVLYTDGLVERRGEVIDEGIARLVEHSRGRGPGGCDVVATELADLVPDPTDDIAILCVVPGAP